MKRLLENYHSHTRRCRHAEGGVSDYARAAADCGARVLGICDHVPWPDDQWLGVRMSHGELGDYAAEIQAARAAFPDLEILAGFECEFRQEYRAYLDDEILGRHGFTYLIGGLHWSPVNGQWRYLQELVASRALSHYAEHMVKAMESGLFSFIAHPDLFGIWCDAWTAESAACSRDIFEAAAALRMPLEINGYGFRKSPIKTANGERAPYPWTPFWELAAEYPITVVCSSDAHRPQDLYANLPECRALADRLGLKPADLSGLGRPRAGVPVNSGQ